MTDQIKMAPCPFCEGPPCVEARDEAGTEIFEGHQFDADDEHPCFSAHVWCHDCGARGPNIETLTLGCFEQMYDLQVADVMRIAVERWNDRHAQARACYDAGEREGLNLWPRGDQ